MKKSIKVIGDIYNAGVYCFKEIDTGNVIYVGSSTSEMNDRKSYHLTQCRKGKYNKDSKRAIQLAFDNDNLMLEVLKVSASTKEVKHYSKQQLDDLRRALSVLEMFYIDLYNPICNVNRKVTHSSSNRDKTTSDKRKAANSGMLNPNCSKFTEDQIKEIKVMLRDGVPYQEIANLYNTTYSYIVQIKNGHKWNSVDIT